MRIAIIGAGSVGAALARGWARAGHNVVLGLRDPSDPKHAELAVATNAERLSPGVAAASADVVALALPWTGAEAAVKALGDLRGKIIVDAMNPLQFKDGRLSLDRGFTTSGAEALAGWLPGARIVKAMNQIAAELMDDAASLASRPCMFIAGDDDGAKAIVRSLVEALGFEVFDAGALAEARLLEPMAMVFINQAIHRGEGRDFAFAIVRRKT